MKNFGRKIFCLLALILLWVEFTAAQQAGDLDPTFNVSDPGFGNGIGPSNIVRGITIQPDGKVILTGDFFAFNGKIVKGIARFQTNGSMDTGFETGLAALSSGNDTRIYGASIQSDGKIIIVGLFDRYGGISRNNVVRINSNGSLDTTFDPGTGTNGTIVSSVIQPDGKIIIIGAFTSFNGIAKNRIARLNSNGSLDTSFDPGSGVNGSLFTARLQADGKILIGGSFGLYNGVVRNSIARILSNGTLDTSFNPGTGVDNFINAMAIQTDGKVVIGGGFLNYNGTPRTRIARINTDGSLDSSFDPGTGATSTVNAITVQPDGKILVSGNFFGFNGASRRCITRLLVDGSLDSGFDPGTGADNTVVSMALQTDGKIIIGGYFVDYNGSRTHRRARVNTNGSFDATFTSGEIPTGVNNEVWSIINMTDSKILLSGFFTAYNGATRRYITRINADGTLDPSFDPGIGADNAIYSMALQTDGKIIIVGNFSSYGGTSRNYVARLNADGTLDASFDAGTGANARVYSVAIQPDGKILIGGLFTSFNGTARTRLARLNIDGSVDATFTQWNYEAGEFGGSYIHSITLQPDGKILIGGFFNLYNGAARNCIARLNTDGGLDTSFNPGAGANNTVRVIKVQTDGKIVICGYFTQLNAIARNAHARLNANGSIDTSYDPTNTATTGGIYTLAIQQDGKIIISGNLEVTRLNVNGTVDANFNPGLNLRGQAYGCDFQGSNKLIIGGNFISHNGVGKNGIVRISLADLPVNVTDSLALVSLYNTTQGNSWTDRTNWLGSRGYYWKGVSFVGSRVRSINLSNNNLEGNLPVQLGNLASLTSIDLASNKLRGTIPENFPGGISSINLSANDFSELPNFSSLSAITSLDVRNNNLTYKDILPNLAIPGFEYFPQKSDQIQSPVDAESPVGSSYQVSIGDNTPGNVFTWYRNGVLQPALTGNSFTIPALNRSTMGTYTCVITNPSIPELIFNYRNKIDATADISGTLYAAEEEPATSGEMLLLKVTASGGYDTIRHIAEVNSNGTYLFDNVILDDYLINGWADTLVYEKSIPTWYQQTIYWEEADTLILEDNEVGLDIVSTERPEHPTAGQGSITGTFYETIPEPGGKMNVTARVAKAAVTVRRVERAGREDAETLTLVDYLFTNDDGEFSFTRLDGGEEYRLNIQYPGYPMDETSFITIPVGTTLFDRQVGVEAEVKNGKIHVRKLVITGWEEERHTLQAYPNPTVDYIYVKNTSGEVPLEFQLVDSSGKSIKVPSGWNDSDKRWELDIRAIGTGIFILQIRQKDRTENLKVIIR